MGLWVVASPEVLRIEELSFLGKVLKTIASYGRKENYDLNYSIL